VTFFDPPIEQEDKSADLDLNGRTVRPLRADIFGKRLEVPYQGKMMVPDVAKKVTDDFKVEIVAVGPKVYDAKVGEIAVIGIYRDIEIGKMVVFQEDDIRVIL
jgi:hypothetical protein